MYKCALEDISCTVSVQYVWKWILPALVPKKALSNSPHARANPTEMTTSNAIKPTSKTPLHRMELYAKLLRSGMYYVAQWCPRSPPDRQLLILKPGVVPDSTV